MPASKQTLKAISAADAIQYEALWPLLESMRDEYSELSKKKPDGTLNKLKVHGVNRLLTDLKELLKNETIIRYLDLLSDDDLPQYSDVTIILSQYVAAMNSFKDARWHQPSHGELLPYSAQGDPTLNLAGVPGLGGDTSQGANASPWTPYGKRIRSRACLNLSDQPPQPG